MNAFDHAALECLAALADAGSFERAARQLSITQSAVSQRLRALETGLGQPPSEALPWQGFFTSAGLLSAVAGAGLT